MCLSPKCYCLRQDLRSLTEMMRALGYPRLISLGNQNKSVNTTVPIWITLVAYIGGCGGISCSPPPPEVKIFEHSKKDKWCIKYLTQVIAKMQQL